MLRLVKNPLSGTGGFFILQKIVKICTIENKNKFTSVYPLTTAKPVEYEDRHFPIVPDRGRQ
ncbi:MAG: hypothetical protein ACXVI9_08940, partial [Mucilaginibacter sp.]